MFNPIEVIEQKVEELGEEVEKRIQIRLLKKAIQFCLGQLLLLEDSGTVMIEKYRQMAKDLD